MKKRRLIRNIAVSLSFLVLASCGFGDCQTDVSYNPYGASDGEVELNMYAAKAEILRVNEELVWIGRQDNCYMGEGEHYPNLAVPPGTHRLTVRFVNYHAEGDGTYEVFKGSTFIDLDWVAEAGVYYEMDQIYSGYAGDTQYWVPVVVAWYEKKEDAPANVPDYVKMIVAAPGELSELMVGGYPHGALSRIVGDAILGVTTPDEIVGEYLGQQAVNLNNLQYVKR